MDADWVGNISDRKSTNGFIYFLEVVLIIRAVKNNQQLHYQARK
jgi:hypothetical protein